MIAEYINDMKFEPDGIIHRLIVHNVDSIDMYIKFILTAIDESKEDLRNKTIEDLLVNITLKNTRILCTVKLMPDGEIRLQLNFIDASWAQERDLVSKLCCALRQDSLYDNNDGYFVHVDI